MSPDNSESWREFRARFSGGMSWRELLGYIRDDRVMKTKLAVLVWVAVLGLVSVVAAVVGAWVVAAMGLVLMITVAFIGYNV